MRGQNTTRRELDPNVPSAYASTGVSSVLLSRSATEALLAGERVDGPTLIGLGDNADYPPSFQLTKQVVCTCPPRRSTIGPTTSSR